MIDEQQEKSKDESNKNEISRTIFSQDDVRNTMKGFVLAYIRGTIKVNFPTVDELQDDEERKGKTPKFQNILKKEIDGKVAFTNKIEIVSGTIKSTTDEQESAIHELFHMILALRAGDRIDGTFLGADVEEKLSYFDEQTGFTEYICWNCGHYSSNSPAYEANPSQFKDIIRKDPSILKKIINRDLTRIRSTVDLTESI